VKTSRLVTFSTLALSAAACSDEGANTKVVGNQFEIVVQPLTIGTIGGASYAITVKNADATPNNIVWQKSGITSGQYGDGRGAISYIGPCDASRNPHTVELVVESLSGADNQPLAVDTWANPAPTGRPIVLQRDCLENADVPVVFNLTIMRDAEQGFFDIAVNFEDIFCSAKVDCQRTLLHDGEERGPTVVFGFACTAGGAADGAQPTWLHLTDLVVTCDGLPPLYFDPSGARGQHGPLGTLPTLYETAIYRDQEALPGLDKCSWNAALGVKVGNAPNCRLTAQATASHASFGTGGTTPVNTVYPFVDFDVLLTDAGGNLICTNNGLDDPTSGVTTQYTPPAGAGFTHEWECDASADPIDQRLLCAGELGTGTTVDVLPTPDGLSVTMGGVRSVPYRLPAGVYVGSEASCCVNPCCDTSD
jgi:hypothetical protein